MYSSSPRTHAPWGGYVGIGPLTVEEYDTLPFEDGWTFELHGGRLIRTPGPGNMHADISTNFYDTVHAYLKAQKLGKLKGTSCYLLSLSAGNEALLRPSLSYILPERLPLMVEHGAYIVGPPDLAIEITSPNDYRPQMEDKAKVYLQAGVRLVWVVWPNRQIIDVWQPASPDAPTAMLQVADTLDGRDVIPGFTCPVSDIFADE